MNSEIILKALRDDVEGTLIVISGISAVELAAARFALHAHEGQVRKVTGEPYVNHCGAVADIVRGQGGTINQIAAAWLHDVIEDTKYDLTEIIDKFGMRIAILVLGMTSASKLYCPNAPRADRKRVDRSVMCDQMQAVKEIKLADILHNAGTIAGCGKEFALQWFKEASDMLDVMQVYGGLVPAVRAKIAEETMKLRAMP